MKANVVNVKKVTAVAIAFLMMILSVLYANSKSEAANKSRKYLVFDAKTGEKIDDYTLDAIEVENNSRSVIDDRYETWNQNQNDEASGVVKIIDSNDVVSSGFVVNDHVIATAAHCVYNYFDKGGQSISEILLFDKNGNNTLKATPVEYHIPEMYTVNKYKYDYAIITVKEDLSSYKKFNLGVPLDSCIEKQTPVKLTGFPHRVKNDKEFITVNTVTEHEMYTSDGIIIQGDGDEVSGTDEFQIATTTYASSGNSGGPIYLVESYNDEQTYYTVIGIMMNISGECISATRITTELINFYKHNKYLLWE